ncbi:MAG TPA: ABC transporter permease [Gemmatimonadota bacterium]|nr:ABC transporter permease [Gemmatimonadota bacterium]
MKRLVRALSEFWADVRAQKLRTTLTILGIAWGTVAVVVLLAFAAGLETHVIKRFHGLGDRIVILFGGETTKPYAGFGDGRPIRLREADATLLARQIPQIVLISPEYSSRDVPVRHGRSITNPNITGVWPSYTYLRNVIPDVGGRFINQDDHDQRRRVVVLGNAIRDLLFEGLEADVVGRQVMIGETPFTVIGVMRPKDQSSSYNSRDRDRVFIPASTHAAMFGQRYVSNIIYRTTGGEATQEAERAVFEVLGGKYRFDPTDDDALGVWDTAEFEKMFGYLFLGFNVFFLIVGTFTLTVGGIGVANIMYIVVKERTKEIGIKRSLGATRRDILGQFFLESTGIVMIGAALGFAASIGIVRLMAFIPIRDFVGVPIVSGKVAWVTMGLLMCVALLAGLFPARRAAALDPIDCLRQ